ncbi:MAG TPA: winged helix-turn-helix domain-containing protein [Candidatus Acidoferrum sp.]|nr:winged helix-turn-helix domain-containing protein [Candidatus Acidoferrum sp.]
MAPEPNALARTVRFGLFEADLSARELRKGGIRIKVHGQPFEVLALLLERPGSVIPREEIRQRLWPTDTFVDFDHGVNTAINRLREALGDPADNPRFIETVPRRGYRFVAPVEAQNPAAPESTEIRSGSPPGAMPAEMVVSRSHAVRAQIILASCLVVAIGLLVTLRLSRVRERLFGTNRPPRIQSLAVLPLVNLSSDAGQDYFADGMTDELTTDLGKISALRVISRTSAMQYKGSKKPLGEIARELNVDAVVEGTLARSGNHLRITANLVQASPESHLWAESYESEVGDALTVQGEIAQAVAREVRVQLTQQEQHLLAAVRPVNPEAQDLYLRGFYTLNSGSGSAESSEKAIKYFQQAIEKDPNYGAAYCGLAIVYATWIPGMTHGPRELMPKAKEFVLKALSLDNTLAAAHSLLGSIKLFYDWDWFAAEQEYKQTMKLNPNDIWAHNWHSRGLVTAGRTEEAIAETKISLAVTPSPIFWDYPIWVCVLAHRYDLASERAHQLVEVAPNWVWGHFEMAQVLAQQGKLVEAAQESLKADELFGTDPKQIAQLKEAMTKSGAQGYWRRTLENYRESAKSNYVPSVLVAQACMRVGDKECAFEWLERGFDERDDLMINLKVEPVFDSLHSDPRFQDLVHRVGIPQ